MTSIDVERPIRRHLVEAERKFDDAIERLRFPEGLPPEVARQRELAASPAYQYGLFMGQLKRGLEEMAIAIGAGFAAAQAPRGADRG